jgi:putative ABC transport system permease protein
LWANLLLKTYRELWQKKGLIVSLSLVLAIAAGAYIGMTAVYQDLKFSRDQYYQQTRLADFTVLCTAVPEHVIQTLKTMPNVRVVEGRVHARIRFAAVKPQQATLSGAAYSLPSQGQARLNRLRLRSGRFPKPHSNEVLLLAQFAKAHQLHIGSDIEIIFPAGKRLMTVVGEAFSPEHVIVTSPDATTFTPQEAQFGIVYLPQSTLARLAGLPNQYNEIMVATQNKHLPAVEYTLDQMAGRLHDYGVRHRLLSKDQMSVNMLNTEINNIKITATFFPILFLLVGALVINVLLQRLVKQQRGIIGMLKAMGMSRSTLLLHYLSYGLLIGVLGSVFGIALGWWIQHALVSLYTDFFAIPGLAAHFHLQSVLIGSAISFLAALLGALVGALRAVRLSPASAMQSQLSANSMRHSAWQSVLWQRCPFYLKMALRTMIRDLWRSAVGVVTVILSLTLVYLALTMQDSMMTMVDMSIDQLSHYEVSLFLRQPAGERIIDSIAQIPGIARVETQLVLPASISFGPYHKQVVIEGLAKNSRLFTPLDQYHHPLRIPTEGLVLSHMLAQILHAKVGDRIQMQLLLGHRTTLTVPIVALTKAYMGLPAYANQSWLSHRLDSGLAFNRVLIKLQSHYSFARIKHSLANFSNVTNVQYIGALKAGIVETMEQFLGGFVAVILLFAATIAIASLYNNAMVSINERQRDVATFTVLGLSHWQIFRIFLLEGIILLLIGIILGMPIAFYFSKLLFMSFDTELFRFPVMIYFNRLYESAIIMVVFFAISYAVVLRFIYKTVWQELLNVRE